MQIIGALLNGERWLLLLFIILIAGCKSKEESGSMAHDASKEGLVLLLDDVNDRVVISVANTGENDVLIHREMLPSGKEPELAFEFDGVIAGWEDAPHRGQVAMRESPNATVTVHAEQVFGFMFFKEELRRFYSLNKDGCYQVRVVYQSTLEDVNAFRGKLASNPTEICF